MHAPAPLSLSTSGTPAERACRCGGTCNHFDLAEPDARLLTDADVGSMLADSGDQLADVLGRLQLSGWIPEHMADEVTAALAAWQLSVREWCGLDAGEEG